MEKESLHIVRLVFALHTVYVNDIKLEKEEENVFKTRRAVD